MVYTIGVGRNIEWDKEVMKKYGTIHHGWDPTPTAEDFFKKKGPPKGFVFHKLGLGVKDGVVKVKLPVGHGDSWTIAGYRKPAQEGMLVGIEVRTLKTLLEIGGFEKVAILKMDVEGVEFDVVDGWAREEYSPPVEQILIEFHERYFMASRKDWKGMVPKAVRQLENLGFALIHSRQNEYSFVRSPCAGKMPQKNG